MIGMFFVILSCLLWAVDTLFRYPLLSEGISATRIVFSEHLFLFFIFLPIFLKSPKKFLRGKFSHLFSFVIVGVFGSALATLAFTHAFTLINPSIVILLQKLQPLVAIILARIVVGERINKKFIFWASVCLLGSILMAYQDISSGFANFEFSMKLLEDKLIVGYLLTLFSVFFWGSSTVFGKKLSSAGYDEKEIMAGRFILGLFALLPFVYINSIQFDLDFSVWRSILIMTLLTGVVSMYLYYQGLKRISARVCALLELSFPFSAVLINWFFLSIPITTLQLLGGIVLLSASTIIQLKRY